MGGMVNLFGIFCQCRNDQKVCSEKSEWNTIVFKNRQQTRDGTRTHNEIVSQPLTKINSVEPLKDEKNGQLKYLHASD